MTSFQIRQYEDGTNLFEFPAFPDSSSTIPFKEKVQKRAVSRLTITQVTKSFDSTFHGRRRYLQSRIPLSS